jgi:hypothetical protein
MFERGNFMMNAMMLAGLQVNNAECPICEEPFENGALIHRECLEKKFGNPLPDEINDLIAAFDLENIEPTATTRTR